jgi:hypothetical protein
MGLKEHKAVRWASRQLTRISHQLSSFRWAFMPLGLCALVAVGVHAAADVLDDPLLSFIDGIDKAFDWLFSTNTFTQPWVNAFAAKERVFVCRAVMFVWEVAADIVLALPALGYVEAGHARPRKKRVIPIDSRKFPALVERVREDPTVMRIARPVATAAVVLAGACALARMIQARVFLSFRPVTGVGFSSLLARTVAIGCLLLVIGSFGWRAFLRSVEHADEAAAEEGEGHGFAAFRVGWVGTVLTLPLAVAALVGAAPLFSFFR